MHITSSLLRNPLSSSRSHKILLILIVLRTLHFLLQLPSQLVIRVLFIRLLRRLRSLNLPLLLLNRPLIHRIVQLLLQIFVPNHAFGIAGAPNIEADAGIAMGRQIRVGQIVTIAPGIEIGPVPVFSDLVSLQYVRPEVGGDILFGNSDLSDVEDADPDNYLNRATDAFVDLTVDKVGTRFPGFTDAAISSSYAGCYDVTPDWNPVISTTALDGLVVAAGFSGHGFKIAPAVGRLVADLIVDGHSNDPRIPHSDFRLSRFADDDLLKSPYPYVGAGQMR